MANFDAGVNFGRAYSLEFFPLNKSASAIKFGQDRRLTAKDYRTGLAVEFNVVKTTPPLTHSSTDKADITIYNINPDTSRAIQRPGLFSFSLGHGNNLSVVFQGQKTTTATGIVGNDTFLNIPMVAGTYLTKERYFSKTYNSGSSTLQIANDLIDHIQEFKYPYTKLVGLNEFNRTNPKDNIIYKEPKTLRGDAVKLLAELLPGFFVFITDSNTVNIVRRVILNTGPLLAGPSLKWSPRFGQIDYIKYTTDITDDGTRYGIQTRGILNPAIRVGTIMQVDTTQQRGLDVAETVAAQLTPSLIELPDKFFCRVTSVRHFGNTYEGDFLTEWVGDYIETDAVPTI